jgi:nucleotide-binding universal stress UspA family protein
MYKKILMPVDVFEMDLSDKAVRHASFLAKADNATITLLNVLPVSGRAMLRGFSSDIKKFETFMIEESEKKMKELKRLFDIAPENIDTLVRFGNVRDEIIALSADGEYDVIVIGSKKPGITSHLLGELVLHRPSSGSFVSYAREFLGEKAAFVAGWMYFVNWAMTGIVDITAVALYMHYWGAFGDVPQWVFALGALAIVGTMNMIGVKWFAEMEFWFALVKVLAIVIFLVVGTVFLGSGHPLDGNATGFHLITDNGGMFPHGLLPALVLVQGVVFAFASIELVGTAAGVHRRWSAPERERHEP